MASNDSNRYRKTYSFFRAPPVNKDVTVVSGGFGINVTGTQNAIVISVDTTVITGSGGGGTGSITPVHNVRVVDPSGTGTSGAFSGTEAFSTIQAAYNSLGSTATATILCAPGSVGSLTIAPGTNQNLTIRSLGSINAGSVFLSQISIQSNNGNMELIDINIPFGDGATVISDDTVGNTYGGLITLTNCFVGDIIDIPAASLLTQNTDVTGVHVICGNLTSRRSSFQANITTLANSVTWDEATEMAVFRAAGTSQFANGFQVFRFDDGANTGNVAPDAAHTYSDNIRVIVQPNSLSNDRIYKFTHTNGSAAGAIVDVWTQGFNTVIHDGADATLLTVSGSSNPIRLFLYAAPPSANFTLINVLDISGN